MPMVLSARTIVIVVVYKQSMLAVQSSKIGHELIYRPFAPLFECGTSRTNATTWGSSAVHAGQDNTRGDHHSLAHFHRTSGPASRHVCTASPQYVHASSSAAQGALQHGRVLARFKEEVSTRNRS